MLAATATALGIEEPLNDKLARLAQIPIPIAADCGIVDLASGEGVERVCMEIADWSRTAHARDFQRRNPPGPRNPVVDVLRTGETAFVKRVDEDILRRMVDDEVQLEILRRHGPRSYISVPMRASGETYGVFTFSYTTSGRIYAAADVVFFEAFVSAIALPIFAMQRMERAARPRVSSIQNKRSAEKKSIRRPR